MSHPAAWPPVVTRGRAALPICTVVSPTTDQGPCDLGRSRFTKAELTDVPAFFIVAARSKTHRL